MKVPKLFKADELNGCIEIGISCGGFYFNLLRDFGCILFEHQLVFILIEFFGE